MTGFNAFPFLSIHLIPGQQLNKRQQSVLMKHESDQNLVANNFPINILLACYWFAHEINSPSTERRFSKAEFLSLKSSKEMKVFWRELMKMIKVYLLISLTNWNVCGSRTRLWCNCGLNPWTYSFYHYANNLSFLSSRDQEKRIFFISFYVFFYRKEWKNTRKEVNTKLRKFQWFRTLTLCF